MQQDNLSNNQLDPTDDEIANNPTPGEDPADRFLRIKGKGDITEAKKNDILPNSPIIDINKEEIVEKTTDSKELDTLKERLNENQSYARSIKRSMSFLNKSIEESVSKINEFVENGDLSEEQSKAILSILKAKNPSDNVKEPKSLSEKIEREEDAHPFQKFYDVANKDILEEYILQAADDDDHENEVRNQVKDQIRSFDYFMQEASEEELKSLYEELSKIEDKPTRLLKKMLTVGKQFMDEGYSDFNKAGGIRKYLKEKNSEIEILHKKIDKLDKELAKYKMYDKPTYNIKESSNNKSPAMQTSDPVDKLLHVRRNRE